MKLAARPELDLLCGEYLVGTLRGPARRRFERSLVEEPLVASRLHHWEQTMAFEYPQQFASRPSASTWRRIRQSLALKRLAPPWYQRVAVWRTLAMASSLALLLVVVLPLWRGGQRDDFHALAVMQGKTPDAAVDVALSADGARVRLSAVRPALSGPEHSFELWLIVDARSVPLPVAVLGSLDGELRLPASLAGRIRPGTQLAVSVEPPGGSQQAGPSGPVIAIGTVRG